MDAPVSSHPSVRPYPATRVLVDDAPRSLAAILAEMGDECISEDRPLPHREGNVSWYPVEMV